VCGDCIVGEYVPVFRPKCKRWNFGEVVSFVGATDSDRSKFELSFGIPESEREWLEIDPRPFEAYVASHHRNKASSVQAILGSPPLETPASGRKRADSPYQETADDTPIPLKRQFYSNGRSQQQLQQQQSQPHHQAAYFGTHMHCPHTPVKTSVCRTLQFDHPGLSNRAGALPVAQPSPSCRHWTLDVSASNVCKRVSIVGIRVSEP